MSGVGSGQSFSKPRGARPGASVEYRLMREAVLREFRRGRLGREDVCDAQSELVRVARNLGRPTEVVCPICEEADLVHVTFAFGPRLPAQGRALSPGELNKLARSGGEVTCYLVEVCTECSWNHLLSASTVGGVTSSRIR